MRNIFKTVLAVLLIAGLSLGLYSNGLNLNGIGTRAISMGGAFIGVSSDYSAVFWNPAGLTQLDKSSLSIFSSFIIPTGTYTYSPAGIDIETEKKTFPTPAFAYINPISEKLTIGFAAYATAGAGATWPGDKLAVFNTYAKKGDLTAYKWSSKVGAFTFSPIVSYKLSDTFSIGATLNVVYGLLDMEKEAGGQYTESLNGTGFGATIGAMFKPSDKFSFGITYKTPQKVKLTGTVEMPGLAAIPGMPTSSNATREVTWPMWLGAGIAFTPNDKLTIAFDVQYTNWKKLDTIDMTFDEAFWKVNMGSGSIEDNAAFELMWDDTIQYRFGFEYLLSDSFAVRAGYYYDPAPAPATTLNILLPSITYSVITAGIGYKTDSISLDVGVEYLKGTDRDADMAGVMAGTAMPGTHGMSMIVPSVSFTYRFNK